MPDKALEDRRDIVNVHDSLGVYYAILARHIAGPPALIIAGFVEPDREAPNVVATLAEGCDD